MIIDRYLKFILTVIAVSLFIIAMNTIFPPLQVNAQDAIEGKTFTFQGIPNLEEFCLEMEEMSLAIEVPEPITFEELTISWPEIEKLCGM